MQSVSSRIWTRVAVSISYNDNDYTTGTSIHEGDNPHWSVRYWVCLILYKCYSLDLPRSWRWRTKLECEMPRSPDTLRVLLTGFAEVVKLTTQTGLWDAGLMWNSTSVTRRTCRGREGDYSNWTVRCPAHLILYECYSPDLVRSWRWRTTLDWDVELVWYSLSTNR